jgi:hypothetical protein
MKVKDLIKQLLDFEMDDDVAVEIESDELSRQRSDILRFDNDDYGVRIVTKDFLLDRDSPEWVVEKA